MGVLGELFPGPKIKDESGEAGDGQQWRLGPIDLDNRTVSVQPTAAADDAHQDGADQDPADPDGAHHDGPPATAG